MAQLRCKKDNVQFNVKIYNSGDTLYGKEGDKFYESLWEALDSDADKILISEKKKTETKQTDSNPKVSVKKESVTKVKKTTGKNVKNTGAKVSQSADKTPNDPNDGTDESATDAK
jgi:hypothetical protein